MSKAEAIVVSEPKQKVVPDFNEKEVIGIVNSGIQTGQVALPAGGTKLYLHKFSLDGYAYDLLTFEKRPLNELAVNETFYVIAGSITGYKRYEIPYTFVNIYSWPSSLLAFEYDTSEGTVTALTKSVAFSTITDNVIEL